MKRYLVACKNEEDCIEIMRKSYLNIRGNIGKSSIKLDKKARVIVSENYYVFYRLPNEIEAMRPETFEGVMKTDRYCRDMLVTPKQRMLCNKLIELSKVAFGENDKENFLEWLIYGR